MVRVFDMPHGAVYTTRDSAGHRVGPADRLPPHTSVCFGLPDATRFAYVAQAAGAESASDAPAHELGVDAFLSGNQFRPLHDDAMMLAAQLCIAGGRRLDMGPESERVVVGLRGHGMVFTENGDTHNFRLGSIAILPAGEPARLWAQGPEDLVAIVMQPKTGAPAGRRTLASVIRARQTAQSPTADEAGGDAADTNLG